MRLLAIVLLSLLAPAAALAVEAHPADHPWRETEVTYGHYFHPLSDMQTEPRLPVYGHRFSVLPRVRLVPWLEVHAQLTLDQDLVESPRDVGPGSDHDFRFNDLLVGLRSPGITEPYTGVRLAGGLHVLAPTSAATQDQSLLLAAGVSVELSRSLPVLAGLTLGYAGRFTPTFFKYTTIMECSGPGWWCNTGIRTSWAGLAHGPSLRFQPISRLTLEASLLFLTSFLHPLPDGGAPGANLRSEVFYAASAGYRAFDFLIVRLGVTNEGVEPLPECLISLRTGPGASLDPLRIFLEVGFFFDALL